MVASPARRVGPDAAVALLLLGASTLVCRGTGGPDSIPQTHPVDQMSDLVVEVQMGHLVNRQRHSEVEKTALVAKEGDAAGVDTVTSVKSVDVSGRGAVVDEGLLG